MLTAGFSSSCITPPLPFPLAGFSRREGPSWKVSQQLWARSMVLDDGANRVGWVVCDLLEVGQPLVAAVRAAVEATGCLDAGNVMVGATHTHAGPDVYGEWGTGGRPEAVEAYREYLPHAIATSLVGAVSDLEPATLAWGEVDVQGVGASRRAGGTAPLRLGALVATGKGGLRGMRVVYPCHGTVLGPDNLTVNGDIIGAAVQAIEHANGAAGRCSWAQGAAGDVSTRTTRRSRAPEELERLAMTVASGAAAAAAGSRPLPADLQVRLRRAGTPLALKDDGGPGPQRGAPAVSERAPGDRSEAALLEEALAVRAARREDGRPREDRGEVCALSLGDLALCFLPGEPFGSIEQDLIARTGLPGVRVVGYSNGAPGYVFTPEDEVEGGYEVMASPLTGEAGTQLVSTAAELLSHAGD